jgi:membrane associated rhomboid family serine protease
MIPIRDRLPRRRAPLVNYLLILLNVVAFLWESSVIAPGYPPQRLLLHWGLVPARLLADPIGHGYTVLTSMFLHDPTNWLHIGGNMLFLWIFGDNVEDALGHGRYLVFYLLSGLAAAGAQMLLDPGSTVPMVGASGAIAGVLAAYATLYPRAPVTVINPIFLLWFFFGIFLELPAWVVIGEFFLVNLYNGFGAVGRGASSGVAFFAHLGGFVAGLILVRLFLDEPRGRDHDRWQGFRSPPRRPPGGFWAERPSRPKYNSPPQSPHRPWDG